MKILLINNNPVVSRLTALSARKEDIEIDEVQEVTELNTDSYDIVFVDADSWTKDVRDVISENIKVQKTVLFYSDEEENEKENFDLSILKPFLPSEVSAVIRLVEDEKNINLSDDNVVNTEENFNILDNNELDNELLLDIEKDKVEVLSLEEEKEELSDNLSLMEDNTFNTKLDEAFPISSNSLEDDLFNDMDIDLEKKEVKEESEEIDENIFELDIDKENNISLENELFSEDSKDNINEELLDLDLNIDEIKTEEKEATLLEVEEVLPELDEEPSTKILDQNEIENIKGLLSEDTSSDMVLEDLMPPAPSAIVKEEEEEEKKSKKDSSKKVKESSVLDTDILVETLTAMPIEKLRELLAGAKVKIIIKFPKAK